MGRSDDTRGQNVTNREFKLATTKVKATKVDKKAGILTFHTPWINRLRLKKALLTNPNKTIATVLNLIFPNAIIIDEIENELNLFKGTLQTLRENTFANQQFNISTIDKSVDYEKELGQSDNNRYSIAKT